MGQMPSMLSLGAAGDSPGGLAQLGDRHEPVLTATYPHFAPHPPKSLQKSQTTYLLGESKVVEFHDFVHVLWGERAVLAP